MAIETAMGTLEAAGTGALQQAQQMPQVNPAAILNSLINSRLSAMGGMVPGSVEGTPALPMGPANPAMPGIPQGNFGSTGEMKRAEQQNLFQSIGSIVNTATQRHYEQKVQKLKQDVELYINAVRGYNEGMTTGNKELASHNAAIIKKLMADEKVSKALSKAFNVDLNPMEQKKKEKKPSAEADAVKKAFQENLQKSMKQNPELGVRGNVMRMGTPQNLGPNPQAAMIERLTQSGVLPKMAEELKFYSDLQKIAEQAQTRRLDDATKLKLGQMLVDSANNKNQQYAIRTLLQFVSAEDRTDALKAASKYQADKRLAGVQDRDKILKDTLAARTAKGDASQKDKYYETMRKDLNDKTTNIKARITADKAKGDTNALAADTAELQRIENLQTMLLQQVGGNVNITPGQIDPNAHDLTSDEIQGMIDQINAADEAEDRERRAEEE